MKNQRKNIKKTLLLFLAVCGFTITAKAQDQSDSIAYRKNAVKTNIVPPLLSATSEFSYERFVKRNLSFSLGVGANWRGNKSDFYLNSDADLTFLNRDIKNRYLLAEVRRYIDFYDCEGIPPHGFYAGGFLRYNSLDFSSDVEFGSNSTNLGTTLETKFKSLNFGILLGYQVNVNNWIVDFEIGGLGYTPNWVDFNSSSTLSNDELAQLSDVFSQNFGVGGNYKEIELNSSEAEFNFWYWTFRYAVSIGYSF